MHVVYSLLSLVPYYYILQNFSSLRNYEHSLVCIFFVREVGEVTRKTKTLSASSMHPNNCVVL